MKIPIPTILDAVGRLLDTVHESAVLSIEVSYDAEIHMHLGNRTGQLDLLTLVATRMDAVTKVLTGRTSNGYWRVEVRGMAGGVRVQPVLLLDQEPTAAQLAPLRALIRAAVQA